MTEDAVEVSILIVNWNTRDILVRCLDALPTGIDDELAYEVIVVDNGSVDGSAEVLASRPGITLIRNSANLGFAAAVNQAYERSSGELVLLLNSDVDLTPGALSELVRFLRRHAGVAGVAPLYTNPDGSPQPFHFRFPTFATILANGSAVFRRLNPASKDLLRRYRMSDEDFSVARAVPQPSASCLLLRRSCLPGESLLDERYPIFFNDVKLALDLTHRGHELWVTPEATVVHEAHSSTRQLSRGGRRQYLASTVRLLSDTEPAAKLWLYRAVVFAQNLALWAARRPEALRGRELWDTLAGDPGPLPAQPAN